MLDYCFWAFRQIHPTLTSLLFLEHIIFPSMCHQRKCGTCGKPTWFGCGKHIDSALEGVPNADRCHCKASTQAEHDAAGGGASGCTVN